MISNSAKILQGVARERGRREIGIGAAPPFSGVDLWNAYEVSWRNDKGKPNVAIGTFVFPASTPCLVESKSLKLYLHSQNEASFRDMGALRETIARDLGAAAGGVVDVALVLPGELSGSSLRELEGESIDELDLEIQPGLPDRELLTVGTDVVEETLTTSLLKSNCPLTGQPDWASLQIRYRGPSIDRASLLRYVVSFRLHRDFHEHCVERIFMDILARCRPERLTVDARYTRRGGIDINPFRTNCAHEPGRKRTPRQ